MNEHLDFLEYLTKFHENLRLDFYPKIFENQEVNTINWQDYDIKFYEVKYNFSWLKLLMPTLLITITIGRLGEYNLRKL